MYQGNLDIVAFQTTHHPRIDTEIFKYSVVQKWLAYSEELAQPQRLTTSSGVSQALASAGEARDSSTTRPHLQALTREGDWGWALPGPQQLLPGPPPKKSLQEGSDVRCPAWAGRGQQCMQEPPAVCCTGGCESSSGRAQEFCPSSLSSPSYLLAVFVTAASAMVSTRQRACPKPPSL